MAFANRCEPHSSSQSNASLVCSLAVTPSDVFSCPMNAYGDLLSMGVVINMNSSPIPSLSVQPLASHQALEPALDGLRGMAASAGQVAFGDCTGPNYGFAVVFHHTGHSSTAGRPRPGTD
ncbi:uncharacterized protein BDW70DRAFT_163373 [Aspergillus foveolatus]|uniref:uncharacterized protein n=1 Tax=Aspergillus foveolatus TaxID=210207 RepID=UPI003CCE1EEC